MATDQANSGLAELLIQAFAAFVTLLAVLVALFATWLRSIIDSPRLELSLNNEIGEFIKQSDGSIARYHHLRVSNKRSWAMAKEVKVEVVKLEKKERDGDWKIIYNQRPFPLLWQRETQLGKPDIGQGRSFLCDIGYIKQNEPHFAIQSNCIPYGVSAIVQKGESIRVSVEAICDTARSKTFIFTISWDGKWHDGDREMSQHLKLRKVS